MDNTTSSNAANDWPSVAIRELLQQVRAPDLPRRRGPFELLSYGHACARLQEEAGLLYELARRAQDRARGIDDDPSEVAHRERLRVINPEYLREHEELAAEFWRRHAIADQQKAAALSYAARVLAWIEPP